MIFKRLCREFLLAVAFTAGLFWFSDYVGKRAISIDGGLDITLGLFAFSLVMLVLPAFLGTIPSGFLLAKKEKKALPGILVLALGAALGVVAMIAVNAAFIVFASDQVLEAQIAGLAGRGVSLFKDMGVQEYRGLLTASLVVGALLLALINFGVGLAGGFFGRILGKGMQLRKAGKL